MEINDCGNGLTTVATGKQGNTAVHNFELKLYRPEAETGLWPGETQNT